MGKVALAVFLFIPALVYGQVFKCVDHSGHTTYSQVPCPAGEGASTKINTQYLGPALPEHGAVEERERISLVMEWFRFGFPASVSNEQAMQEIIALQGKFLDVGEHPANALVAAILKVAPGYESAARVDREISALDTEPVHRSGGLSISGVEKPAKVQVPDTRESKRISSPAHSVNISPAPIIDAASGAVMAPAAGGFVDPRSGKFHPRVAGGYIDPESGRFIPVP